MAITHLVPADSDLVTLQEGSELLYDTGHPASVSTIKRWIRRYGLTTERIGRADHVSFTDLLEVHRDEIARRAEAAG